MRLVLAMVLAALVALPLSASAQAGGEDTTAESSGEDPKPSPEPTTEEPAPSSKPAPEEPALQLELDDAGVEVTPSSPRTFLGYTLEELELRKRRTALGLIAPAALIVAGVPLLVRGTTGDCTYGPYERYPDHCDRLYASGMALTISGGVGMIYGLSLFGVRKRELERPYTVDRYTLEARVKRARAGLIVSSVVLGVGVALWVGGAVHDTRSPPPDAFSLEIPNGLIVAGGVLTVVGSIGALACGTALGVRKRRLRRLREAHYGTPRRFQWDLAQSRLVF